MRTKHQFVGSLAFGSALLLGCGSDDPMGPKTGEVAEGDEQTPPSGAADVEAWLAEGAYLTWECEDSVHASRDPSPHGFNRICSNTKISDNVAGSAAWPKGAAAVKELYASLEGGEPIGYAVYLKTADDSADGANWYWYERIREDVIADGLGNAGTAKSICVSCHIAAGADAAHTPTVGGRDQVYTPVAGL